MTAFATALLQRNATAILYLEIEGLPYAYGTIEKTSAWFTSSQFEGVQPWLRVDGSSMGLPRFSEHALNHFEGTVGMGSIRMSLVDVDDSLAGLFAPRRTDDRLRLTGGSASGSDLAYGYTTQLLVADDAASGNTGSLAGGDWPTADLTLYVDGETITASSRLGGTISTLTRGRYRSTAAKHVARKASPSTDTGSIVTQYPRNLRGRQVWLRMGLDAAADSECVTIWHGVLSDFAWLDEGKSIALDLDDATGLLDGLMLFGEWFALFLGRDGAARPELVRGEAEDPPQIWISGLPEVGASYLAEGTIFHARLPEHRLVAFKRQGTAPADDGADGLAFSVEASQLLGLGAPFELHRPRQDQGEETRSVGPSILLAGEISPVVLIHGVAQLEVAAAEATDAASGGREWSFGAVGDHPLQVVLQLLLSTGTGTNYDTADPDVTGIETTTTGYDTLPRDWGVGLDVVDVDVASFEALILAHSTEHVRMLIDGPRDARKLISDLLRPWGYYLVPSSDGLSVRKYAQPTIGQVDAATALTFDDLVIDPGTSLPRTLKGPTPDQDLVIGALEWSHGPELSIEDEELRIRVEPTMFLVVEDEADIVRRQAAGKLKIIAECLPGRPIVTGLTGRVSFRAPVEMTTDDYAASVRARLVAALARRFREPPYRLTIEISFAAGYAIDIGDWVTLSDSISGTAFARIPSATTSARGLSAELFEVWGKRFDLGGASVILDLAQTGASINRERYLAPACGVISWDNGTMTLTVIQHKFTKSGGAYDDSDAFADDDEVRIYTGDLSSRSTATAQIQSRTATTIVIDKTQAQLGITPASGYVVLHADYDDTWTAPANLIAAKAEWSFRADGDPDLAGDAPHLHR